MSTSDVQKLRQETGAGIMDCKKAIDESGGDFDKAREIIAQRGLDKAAKKGDRATGAGHLETYIHSGRVGVMLQIHAETDFVTKAEAFRECAKNIAMHIAASAPETVEELLEQPYVRESGKTISEYIQSVIGTVGENIQISRFCRYEV